MGHQRLAIGRSTALRTGPLPSDDVGTGNVASRSVENTQRTSVRHGRRWSRLVSRIELAIVPATTPDGMDRPDDYRRAVILIALLAVGFFVPSLIIAEVPQYSWLAFTVLAVLAALILSGSFILLRRGSRLLIPWVVVNSVTIAFLGLVYRNHYHELALAYCLVIVAHSVVHGFRPALVMVVLGSILVPFVIHGGSTPNWTDPVYASIYLLGVALIPWVAERLASRRLVEVRRQLSAITHTEREAVLILARAAEAKDEVTGDHVLRVGDLSARLASAIGEPQAFIDDLRFAAMLHDVGKLHVPDRILLKPGPLDPEEWALIRDHTIWGERILGATAGFELARRVARSHHENWDGTGYPDGLVGAKTPLGARIVRLTDAFDALRAERPYKPAWPIDRCLDELRNQAGRIFDPEMTPVFLEILESFEWRSSVIPSSVGALGSRMDLPGVDLQKALDPRLA